MNVAYINPFIEATLRSLDMMAGIKAEKAGLELKEDLITTYDISSIIGLTGETSGSIIISMPVNLACRRCWPARLPPTCSWRRSPP